MPRSLEEITAELVSDTRPNGPDGCTNVERIAYIMDVFECTTFSLNYRYDYDHVMRCDDLDMVLASKHLALLQFDYLARSYYHGHIGIEDFNLNAAVLLLAIQKMNWHISHLEAGRKTPPFPAMH